MKENVPVGAGRDCDDRSAAACAEALGELAGAAKEGLLALSVGVGPRRTGSCLCGTSGRSRPRRRPGAASDSALGAACAIARVPR